MLGDGTVSREETLGLSRRFEPLHVSFALTGGLMRVLGAVVEVPMLAMFHPGENVALSSSVALEFVGDDHARDVGQSLEQLTKELLRGPLIPPTLDQDIEYVPVLIDCPPEIMPL